MKNTTKKKKIDVKKLKKQFIILGQLHQKHVEYLSLIRLVCQIYDLIMILEQSDKKQVE
jgi:hypothetical protein